jgi:hypothetical protein
VLQLWVSSLQKSRRVPLADPETAQNEAIPLHSREINYQVIGSTTTMFRLTMENTLERVKVWKTSRWGTLSQELSRLFTHILAVAGDISAALKKMLSILPTIFGSSESLVAVKRWKARIWSEYFALQMGLWRLPAVQIFFFWSLVVFPM